MSVVSSFIACESSVFPGMVNAFFPRTLIIPFPVGNGDKYQCIVKEGDTVREGQMIAFTPGDMYSAQIHSSVPGTVTRVGTCALPDGKRGMAVYLTMGGSFSFTGKRQFENDWESLTSDLLIRIAAEKGVFNTFGNPYSLAMQVQNIKPGAARLVVVRMFDEDPSRLTDSFLATSFPEETACGAVIIARMLNAAGIIFCIDKKNKFSLNDPQKTFSSIPYMVSEVNVGKYPAGMRRDLIAAVNKSCRNRLNGDNRIFAKITQREIYIDPETALSVYKAIVLGIPVMERCIHVTGGCLRTTGMLNVKIGTTIAHLAAQCGGFVVPPARIIINGLMGGFAVGNLDTPVTGDVKSVTFVPLQNVPDQRYTLCTRCGMCRNICPAHLFPDQLFRYVNGVKNISKSIVDSAILCSGCNLCNSVCQARLPLSQSIAILKRESDYE